MRSNFCRLFVLALIVAVSDSAPAVTKDGCCDQCGCAAPCQKVCRLVCGEKKVDVVCWGCKREDFCIPDRSARGCKHSETVCETCVDDTDANVCTKPKHFAWFDWCPGCGTVHTKTKLMKKVETVTVPSYKWVVDDLCPQCAVSAAAQSNAIVDSRHADATPTIAEEEKSIFRIVRLPKVVTK